MFVPQNFPVWPKQYTLVPGEQLIECATDITIKILSAHDIFASQKE
jgi:hypothetical protein